MNTNIDALRSDEWLSRRSVNQSRPVMSKQVLAKAYSILSSLASERFGATTETQRHKGGHRKGQRNYWQVNDW